MSALKKSDILQKISRLFFLIVILFLPPPCLAATVTLEVAEIKALINETKSLRDEVKQLKAELAVHMKEHKTKSSRQLNRNKPNKTEKKSPKKLPVIKVAAKSTKNISYAPLIAPYLGTTPDYSGSDLLTNLSQQNADLLALQYREQLENASPTTSPYYMVLSGTLGAQASSTRPFVGSSLSDVDLTIANITALAGVGKWVTGFFSFDYDSLPLGNLNPPQYGPRVANSRVYLDQGFITLGNLKQFDLYASIGQMYLPFGQYNSYTINSPLTASLFTVSERPVLVGYSHRSGDKEFDLSAFAYHGETIRWSNSSSINEWGASVDYLVTREQWNGEVSLSYISNIADSEGMLLNSQDAQFCTQFGGFAFPCKSSNVLVHRVPGFDVYGSLTIGHYNFVAEYITATRSFSPIDMTFNERGAKPQALDLEGAYAFNLYGKPSSISLDYAFTKDALALLLPAKEYSITFTTSLWRNTTESVAFQHDINYGILSRATGQSLPVDLPIDRSNLGKSSSTLLFAINAFF